MGRKKIAFIITSFSPGGAERVVANLSNHLINKFDVTLILLYNCKPFYSLDNRIKILFCEEQYEFKKSRLKTLVLHFRFIKRIHHFIKNNNIDLGISFMTTTNVYSILAFKLASTPIIVCERTNPHKVLNKGWKLLRRLIYPFSNILVVQTESVVSYYQSFLNKDKIKIINNPLSPNLINRINEQVNKENIILSVGRLSPEKNHDLIIRAFSKLNLSKWKLLLVGDGICRQEYEKLIFELNMNNSIEIIGNVTDVDRYYNSSKIFVLTSKFEGFPNALTEAMAFGLPCISTDCPSGPSELIKNNYNGFLIPVEDEKALQTKLNQLIENESLRTQFAERAKATVNDFKIEPISNQWSKLINELA